MTRTISKALGFAAALLVGSAAWALPQPPHDFDSGISCGDCHVPYGGLAGVFSSTATGGGTLSLTDSAQAWEANEWVGGVVSFDGGANIGEYRPITSNSADTLYWDFELPNTVSGGESYALGITTHYDIETQCKTCHNPTGMAPTMSDVGLHTVGGNIVSCGACHEPHNIEPNSGQGAGLIRTELRHPSATAAVNFPSGGANDFVSEGGTYDGMCEVCHTNTDYWRNNASGDHLHNQLLECPVCHTHNAGFTPQGGCTTCHDQNQGARRLITGPSGDFAMASHHVVGTVDDADCGACHYTGDHGSGIVKLKDPDLGASVVYEWDAADPAAMTPFCLGCHDSDGSASGGGLTPFTDGVAPPDVSATWGASAHAVLPYAANNNNPISCMGDGTTSGCHGNAHGSDAEKMVETVEPTIEAFCSASCHSGQDDHASGTTFGANGETFTLSCTSCHNPHVSTGMHDEAGKSPLTLPDFTRDPAVNPRAMGTTLWGEAAGEKMDDVAGTGTYVTPNGDTLDGSELADYPTFCLSCHGVSEAEFGSHGGISWGGGEPHGANSANIPNGGGACPDWYGCGKGLGWDGDDCVSDDATCWPVKTRAFGEQIFTRGPYNQDERIAGANFVLSCSDCHVTHEPGIASKLRDEVNGGPGTWIWNTMCNNCHYYYSDWHAGMSCPGCHNNVSIHRMDSKTGSSGTRTFDPDLVVDYAFSSNLNDGGDWRMHGVWRVTSGTYVAGYFGNGIEVDDDPIEVGTRDASWSTDDGAHGTWKFTSMKYNTTLEMWVKPTDDSVDERLLMAKHTYWSGGYALTLKKVDGTLRAGFKTNMTGGSGDCSGLRGAYSSVAIPLDEWSHIAATYDSTLADRDDFDGSVGRVRIWVNGEDVTDSDASPASCYAQPGAGEEAMFPYSDHSPDNEAICYDGHWCASALSVGGVNWSSPTANYVGVLDEVKVWNITKDGVYFEDVDIITPPRMSFVTSDIGSDQLLVTFNEETYASTGAFGDLQPSDFTFTDLEDLRTIDAVTHTAGSNWAVVTLSDVLDPVDDIGVDTLAFAASSAYDEYDNTAATTAVTITGSGACPPTTPVAFLLDDTPGSTYVLDDQAYLAGEVFGGVGALTGSEFNGDGTTYIDFEANSGCLQATRAMTLEARIQPTGADMIGNAKYVQRILGRDSGGANYQMSVWRNNSWDNYEAPDDTTSIALWVRPVDAHGGTGWKVVLTDYDLCPIVQNHWYDIKAVWNSDKVGAMPGDIWVEDQGTDGLGAGQNWAGEINCTDSDQSQVTSDRYLEEGDEIMPADGSFTIGANTNNNANNHFEGLIDWIIWDDTAN